MGGRGGGELVEGCTTVSDGRGKIVEVPVELCHHLLIVERRDGSLTSSGLNGRSGGDAVGEHGQVGGAEGIAPLRRGAKFPIHCAVEWDELQLPGCPRLGRRDEAIPGRAIVREGIDGE